MLKEIQWKAFRLQLEEAGCLGVEREQKNTEEFPWISVFVFCLFVILIRLIY